MGCEGEGNAEENRFWGISAYGSAGGFENAIPRFGKPPKTKVYIVIMLRVFCTIYSLAPPSAYLLRVGRQRW